MQAQQLLTQLSPVENPYAVLLYVFMALFVLEEATWFVSVLSSTFN